MITTQDVVEFDQAVEAFVDELTRALEAATLSYLAIPMRRHDEIGWKIGQCVQGVVLFDQLTAYATQAGPELEDRVRIFIERLQRAKATHSAMPPLVRGRVEYRGVRGLILRFVEMPDGSPRVDVVIGDAMQSAQTNGGGNAA